MRVSISRIARADIQEIGSRIETEIGSRRARAFILDLRDRCAGLAQFPERFALLEGFERANVRKRLCKNYLIIYRVRGGAVEILRVFHGAMDFEKALERDVRLSL